MILNGRFEIKEKFDQGGIGEILKAEDLQDGRKQVVVKILLEQKDPATREWVEKHFYKESEALKKIDHPGVVKLIDSGHLEDGRPFFVMEYIKGGNLRAELDPARGLKGDFNRAARLIKQLGEAITVVHKAGVHHRDLKPENIMLAQQEDGSEQAKIIDFGIATVKESYDEETKATVFAGSLLYMAPEQISGTPTAASDIYALGAIAYEMVTGKTPFTPDREGYVQRVAQLMKMQQKRVQIKPSSLRPSRLPKAAKNAILKALAYNQKDRYGQAEEFGNELAKALTKPIKTKWSKAARIAAAIAVLAVLLIASTIGIVRIINISEKPRSLGYWGVLQRYDDKQKSIGNPIRLSSITGQTYARKGDGITLHFISEENGYLYVFDESIPDESKPRADDKERSYSILFPTPNANNGEAKVRGGGEIAAVEGLFDEESATERIWIIWTAKEESELAEIIKGARKGEIIGSDAERLSGYIKARESREVKAEADKEQKMMRLRFGSEEMVYAMEIEYVGQ